MKLIKYLACGLLFAGSMAVLTACNDDNDLGNPPRLFRPVVSAEASANNLICKWQGIEGATSYKLTVLRDTGGIDENGDAVMEEVATTEVMGSPYTFEDLAWDEKYRVTIQAFGNNIQSGVYETELTSINYPTKLQNIADVIDTGVKVPWSESDDIAYINVYVRNDDNTVTPYDPETFVPQSPAEQTASREGEEEVEPETPGDNVDGVNPDDYYYVVTDEDRENNYCEIYGLAPSTAFRVIAYDAKGEYLGRKDFKTQAAEVYDNPDLVRDLRSIPDEVADTIFCTDFFDELQPGTLVILKGGYTYPSKGTPEISKSVTIKTGMSLSGKAILKTGGFLFAEGNVGDIKFQDVKVETNADKTSSNFGGRYLLNQNKKTKVNSLTLDNVEIRYMRGGVRIQSQPSEFDNVVINNCVFDSIGGYRVLCIDNAGGQFTNVTVTNSTFANCEGVMRNNKEVKGFDNMTISDCTFVFCGTASNQVFDFANNAEQNRDLKFSVTNCIFGPGYGSTEGSLIAFQGFRCAGANSVCAFTNCFMTADAEYAVKADTGAIQGEMPGCEKSGTKTADLWVAPFQSDFSIKTASADCANLGDPRWHL